TSTTEPLTRPKQRVTHATSHFRESRPCWDAITSWPSACSVGISLLKHEPSAQRPWAKTMLGLAIVISSDRRCWMTMTQHYSRERGLQVGAECGDDASMGHAVKLWKVEWLFPL